MAEKLSTQPYKGTNDWLPEEIRVQRYIFDTWREVCLRFGYEEYLTPLLEPADLYRAKSGEVKEELFTLRDRADRELALRPEMTPSVTRLISSIYKKKSKPIRFFSIANFYRNEAPQRGRTREFWQLNADIFGEESLAADLEIISLSLEIMLAFGASKENFRLYFNNRILIDEFFSEISLNDSIREEVSRTMDKFGKIPQKEFTSLLDKYELSSQQKDSILKLLKSDAKSFSKDFPTLAKQQGYQQIKELIDSLNQLNYGELVEFAPGIIRGFEYYDGMIFEVYDLNPKNRRSLFGGGRYNGLSEIFGVENFPATGVAPGNVTTRNFLETWDLLPEFTSQVYYCPLLEQSLLLKVLGLVNNLRKAGLQIEMDLNDKGLVDALRYANKQGYQQMLILGDNELSKDEITVKDLKSGEQKSLSFEKFLSEIS